MERPGAPPGTAAPHSPSPGPQLTRPLLELHPEGVRGGVAAVQGHDGALPAARFPALEVLSSFRPGACRDGTPARAAGTAGRGSKPWLSARGWRRSGGDAAGPGRGKCLRRRSGAQSFSFASPEILLGSWQGRTLSSLRRPPGRGLPGE